MKGEEMLSFIHEKSNERLTHLFPKRRESRSGVASANARLSAMAKAGVVAEPRGSRSPSPWRINPRGGVRRRETYARPCDLRRSYIALRYNWRSRLHSRIRVAVGAPNPSCVGNPLP